MNGKAIITRDALDLYDHALELLDKSISELRHVAYNMMPEALYKYGIRQSISDYCECIGSEKFKVKFAFYGEDRRFDEKLEVACFRIVQELIDNALKHSGATEISVQVISDQERLSFTVQDNGSGMDTSVAIKSEGKGLENIRSVVSSFDGHFDISSEHGNGTEAFVEFRI